VIISIVNHTNRPDTEIQTAIRAVNRQIAEDFEPAWSIGATLRLEGALSQNPNPQLMSANMRGDALIYLEDTFSNTDPFGFHDMNFQGIPFGYVFTELAEQLGEPWETTLSHEALELIADPEVNRLAMGPHPDDPNRDVFHWYEMCDAVQSERYEIDGVWVSNFVLPLYFTGGEETGGRNDFLGTLTNGNTLRSFGINPGGYVGYFDPDANGHETSFADARARERAEIKSKFGLARRGQRYKDRRAVVARMQEARISEKHIDEHFIDEDREED
jgi:hypothetical protein